jgi:hypothetical protein
MERKMNKTLLSYYREDGKPVGCIAAVGPLMVGWSLCSKKDTFNKKLARIIAIGRAKKPERAALTLAAANVPYRFMDKVCEMYERSTKYFKE